MLLLFDFISDCYTLLNQSSQTVILAFFHSSGQELYLTCSVPTWKQLPGGVTKIATNGAFPLHGTARYGTVHFWGVFHWVLYLVPDTFLVPLRSRFHASRYRYQNVTCKLCWSLIGRRESSLLRHWTCDTRPSSTVLPARFKSAQPAKDRTQLLFKQTHIFASTTK